MYGNLIQLSSDLNERTAWRRVPLGSAGIGGVARGPDNPDSQREGSGEEVVGLKYQPVGER